MVRQLRTFVVCWTISAFACVGCGFVQGPGKGTQKGAAAAGPSKRTCTREEFTKLVTGKTEADVIAAVGKPESTSETGGTRFLRYKGVTVDPVTGKTDYSTQVRIDGGVCSMVSFF